MLLNKHNLAIANLASKDQSRYPLTAIQVTQKRTVVTNGHYAVMVTLPDMADIDFPRIPNFTPANGETPDFLLCREDALAIAKVMPSKERISILNNAQVGTAINAGFGESRAIASTDLETQNVRSIEHLDGTFPNIEQCYPSKGKKSLTIGLSAEYLYKLAKSALDTCSGGRRKSVVIKLTINDPQMAVLMKCHNFKTHQDWTAVLMPCRI